MAEFKKGDKVVWLGTKATVVEDSPESEETVIIEIGTDREEWYKTYMNIPVVLDESI